jgi:cholesterol transport system auxiliary component
VPQKLRTPRVPVETGGTEIAYLKDAQWVEPPARLFQRLLSETLSASGGRLVLTETELITGPGELLSGDLLDFSIDADSGQAVVTFQAMRLTNDGSMIAQRRFQARESVGELTPANAGAALNRAANRVAAEVSRWMAG